MKRKTISENTNNESNIDDTNQVIEDTKNKIEEQPEEEVKEEQHEEEEVKEKTEDPSELKPQVIPIIAPVTPPQDRYDASAYPKIDLDKDYATIIVKETETQILTALSQESPHLMEDAKLYLAKALNCYNLTDVQINQFNNWITGYKNINYAKTQSSLELDEFKEFPLEKEYTEQALKAREEILEHFNSDIFLEKKDLIQDKENVLKVNRELQDVVKRLKKKKASTRLLMQLNDLQLTPLLQIIRLRSEIYSELIDHL
jgi:hypothetical protein